MNLLKHKKLALDPVAEGSQATVAGDRGIPSINRSLSFQSRISSIFALALVGAVGLGFLVWYYSGAISRQARAEQLAQAASRNKAQGEMPLPPLGPIAPPAVVVEPSAVTDEGADADNGISADELATQSNAADLENEPVRDEIPPSTGNVPTYAAPAAPAPAPPVPDRRLTGPAFSTGAGTVQISSPSAATPYIYESGESPAPGSAAPATPAPPRPYVVPAPDLLLPKGAFIDCTLETAIDSTLPGMVTCVTATDTFGADGEVVLLERGTKLVGETKGDVKQGAARVFVLWTEARTPAGVIVPLESPGADELGRSGLPGAVNRHFFERFGAAILVSVIDGVIEAATRPSADGDTTYIDNSSGSQEILTEVLRSTINIPPTIVKPQGDRIQILVARDLDFRSVYELRPNRS